MRQFMWAFVVVAAARAAAGEQAGGRPASPITTTSPDGEVRAEVFLDAPAQGAAAPKYRVFFRGRPLVLPSRLGAEMADGTALGVDSIIEKIERRSFDESYEQFPGKRLKVRSQASETVITFGERAAPRRRWQLVVRAYNDGVAFRYRFPAQEGWEQLKLKAGLGQSL